VSTVTVDAVVLRRWDWGESDRRLSLLSRERGKFLCIARGARKPKSSLAGATEPLAAGTFEIAFGKRTNYVTQALPKHLFKQIRADYTRLNCALAWVEVLDSAHGLETPSSGAFNLCLVGLAGIETSRVPFGALAWAELKLLGQLGYAPDFSHSRRGNNFVSAAAGGVVSSNQLGDFSDAQPCSWEVLVSLDKLQSLHEPPAFIKKSEDVLRALLPFWLHVLGHDLPAHKSLFKNGA
jgi:DNA repair protein RecO